MTTIEVIVENPAEIAETIGTIGSIREIVPTATTIAARSVGKVPETGDAVSADGAFRIAATKIGSEITEAEPGTKNGGCASMENGIKAGRN